MNKYYFTFGIGQGKLAHKFLIIEASSEGEARDQMFEMFGNKWSFCYPESEWTYHKGTVHWDRLVENNLISPNEPSESLTQAEVFKLTQLVL